MKIVICDGKITYTSDEDLVIHSFDGNMCFSAGDLTTWNADNTIYKDYEKMLLPNALAEVIEVGFAKQEIKESTADKTKKVMALPISNSFSIGERVFLKVKTVGLVGKKLKVEVRQAIEKQLTDKDQKVEALSVAEMTVGKITQSEDAKNKYDVSNLRALENIAMKEMTLEAKTDAEKRNWKEAVARAKDKKIKLYFHVEVLDTDGEVKYDGDDANDPKNFSYKKPFELTDGGCFCKRPLTIDEVTKIIKELRDSEKATKNSYDLFTKDSNFVISDKTYLKFTEKLNETFNHYNIDTCIRRIHFLAQAYHETNRFRSSREEGGPSYLKSKQYYPFYGRGLMQLTWEGKKGSGRTGYKQYFDYLKRSDYLINYNQVESNLNLAFDSAGWFWEQGKTLSNNKPGIWKAPSFAGDVGRAVAKENATVKKTILKYGNDKTEYGVLNLNLLADNDWIDTISWLVNGGGNGFYERRDYLKKLKDIMNYEKCINRTV